MKTIYVITMYWENKDGLEVMNITECYDNFHKATKAARELYDKEMADNLGREIKNLDLEPDIHTCYNTGFYDIESRGDVLLNFTIKIDELTLNE